LLKVKLGISPLPDSDALGVSLDLEGGDYMAQVDCDDASIERYSIMHHRYDESTGHFHWFIHSCFDNQKEMLIKLSALCEDLEKRSQMKDSHPKEEFMGKLIQAKNMVG
jgi:hypothetical protein